MTAPINVGTIVGLDSVYYALLTSDAVDSIVYATPEPITRAISANVNPNSSVDTLFADNGPSDTATTLGVVSLELGVAAIPFEVQAALLGHEVALGVMTRKSTDIPPWVAIGFRSLKSNGKYRYSWLLKGKFSIPEDKNETKGDKIKFQTASIKGNFVKRDADNAWEISADEDGTGYVATTASTWFTTVPTVT